MDCYGATIFEGSEDRPLTSFRPQDQHTRRSAGSANFSGDPQSFTDHQAHATEHATVRSYSAWKTSRVLTGHQSGASICMQGSPPCTRSQLRPAIYAYQPCLSTLLLDLTPAGSADALSRPTQADDMESYVSILRMLDSLDLLPGCWTARLVNQMSAPELRVSAADFVVRDQ
jgi:hypothetical protein